ncbi:MAG: hypothetical protein E6G31_11855, partial [Actinobacteria bacterium]
MEVIAQPHRLFLFLVALPLVVRPVPVALATVPDGVVTNDESANHQFEVNVTRLTRRRAHGRTDDTARWIDLDVETAISFLGEEWRPLIETSESPPTGDPLWQRAYWRAFHAQGPAPRVHALCGEDGVTAVIPVRPTWRLVRQWSSGV